MFYTRQNMTHLPSYKSFNCSDVEEIENRVFCPHPAPKEHALKVCPGSLCFQDDLHHNVKEHVHHSNWRRIKHNVCLIHPNKSTTPEIVHFNQTFPDYDHDINCAEVSDDDTESVNVMQIKQIVKEKKLKKKKPKLQSNLNDVPPESLQIEDHDETKDTTSRCFFCKCKCLK